MKDPHGFIQERSSDTLPDPGTRERAHGDLGGQEMRSTPDGAPRAMIYIRVASDGQVGGQAETRQREACFAAADALGASIVRVYEDIGTKLHFARQRMIGDLVLVKPAWVITCDPSRFTRLRRDHLAIQEQIRCAKAGVIYANGADGRLHFVEPAGSRVLDL